MFLALSMSTSGTKAAMFLKKLVHAMAAEALAPSVSKSAAIVEIM